MYTNNVLYLNDPNLAKAQSFEDLLALSKSVLAESKDSELLQEMTELGMFVTNRSSKSMLVNQDPRNFDEVMTWLDGRDSDNYRVDYQTRSYVEFYMSGEIYDILIDLLLEHEGLVGMARKPNSNVSDNLDFVCQNKDVMLYELSRSRAHNLEDLSNSGWLTHQRISINVFEPPVSIASILNKCACIRIAYIDYDRADVEAEIIKVAKAHILEQEQEKQWLQVKTFEGVLQLNKAVIQDQHYDYMGLDIAPDENPAMLELIEAGIYVAQSSLACNMQRDICYDYFASSDLNGYDRKACDEKLQIKARLKLYLPDSDKAQAFLNLLLGDLRLAVICIDGTTKSIKHNFEARANVIIGKESKALEYVISRSLVRNKASNEIVGLKDWSTLVSNNTSQNLLTYVNPEMAKVLSSMLEIEVVYCEYGMSGLPGIILEHWNSTFLLL